MAVPTNREEFKQYCLRALGHPVIEINVSDEQIEDRIDESIRFYWDYHFDGSEKVYYKHQVTQQDRDNGYITVPENIMGAISVFAIADPATTSSDMFNIRYQIALNDLYNLTSVSMVPYYMAMEHLSLITEMLVGQQLIRYSRHKNRVYVDMDWEKVPVGNWIIVEAYEVIDPAVYADAWADRWLQNYCIAKIKYQWAGANLSKYTDMVLPGGLRFNSQSLSQEAREDIAKLESDMEMKYSLPPQDFVG